MAPSDRNPRRGPRGGLQGGLSFLALLLGWAVPSGDGLAAQGYNFRHYSNQDGLPQSQILALHQDHEEVKAGTLATEAVQAILPHPAGLLIGTDSALYLLVGDDLRPISPEGFRAGTSFNDATLDPSGRVWIATDGGLLRLDGEEFLLLTEASNLPTTVIRRVMADREGNVWAGTDAGAAKLVPGPFRGFSIREGLPNPFARALAEDGDGRLWVGTRHGAAAWSPAEGRFRVTLPGDDLPDGRVFALAPAPGGGMLVGTRAGLAHWAEGSSRLLLRADGLPADYVLSLLPDEAGGVWVGTEGGVARWSEGGVIPFPDEHPLSGLFAVSMAQDLEGRLWIGLPAGGVRIWDGETLDALDAERGLTDQVIWSMTMDPAGRMWIGSNGDGAFRVDRSEIVRFRRVDGLVNDFVRQVMVDSRGSVWLYTSQGLDRFQDGSFEHFGQAAGLIDLEGTASAALEDSQGQLWFGTARGVLAYNPAEEHANLVPPPVRIEDVSLGGLRLDPATELRFRSDLLQIGVAALTFRDERVVRYRYRLSRGNPEEQPWSEPVADRTVSFAGLGPGRYTFQVLAINGDGTASQAPATLSFTVLPEFWQSWWFRILGLGVLVAAAAALPVVRARRLEGERKRLEALVTRSTGELARTNQRLRDEIHERERFEVALQESEARLRDIVENSTNVFYSHTPDHEITYISPQIRELLGVPPDEIANRWTQLATEHPMNEEGQRITEEAIRTGERQSPYELELRHDDGRAVQVRVTEAPLLRDGEVVAIVGSLTDVTEARRMEEEWKRLEEQLRQAQKMEAVGLLAGGIAHDFNNLLTSIVGHTSLMAMELEPEDPLRSDLEEVERACDRAATLVAHLLAFGRRQLARPRNLNLNQAVREAVEKVRHLLDRLVLVETELTSAEPRVLMDAGQLEHVLFNLVLNAGEAMPDGGTITVGTGVTELGSPPDGWGEPDFDPGAYALLTVSDTGVGMDRETAERIFEPFFTTKELGEGSGLGLATVHGIVRQNRGHIHVETAPHQGTTFLVYLPVAAHATGTEGAPPDPNPPPGASQRSGPDGG
jgi:PAS domain S-box-containing protein